MKLFFLGLLFSFSVDAIDKVVLCQSDSFGLRKNYELWLQQQKLIIDDQLEEIPISVLSFLHELTRDIPLSLIRKIAPLESNKSATHIRLDESLYNVQNEQLYQQAREDVCQGKLAILPNTIWIFSVTEAVQLLRQLYSEDDIKNYFDKNLKIGFNAPNSFSFKRFEMNFSHKELVDVFYLFLRYKDFDLFKNHHFSRVQTGLELKNKMSCEYLVNEGVLRLTDSFFKNISGPELFRQMGVSHLELLSPVKKNEFVSMSFDGQLKVKKKSKFINDFAQTSPRADFIMDFEVFFTIADAMKKTTKQKFDYFKKILLNNKNHPELELDAISEKIKNTKQTIDRNVFDIRVEDKGDFQRLDFIFSHPLLDLKNKNSQHLHIKISCHGLVVNAENKDYVIGGSRVRVSMIFDLATVAKWRQCSKYLVVMTQNGRERYKYEFNKTQSD